MNRILRFGCLRNKNVIPSIRLSHSAFSLVEVVVALGIVGFAFVPLMGLLPVSLSNFRSATDVSVGTQIAQRIVNELQQSDFSALTAGAPAQGGVFSKSERYFDDQGDEVAPANMSSAIYQVNTRITPATVLPSNGQNANLVTATIQVANNPAGVALAVDPVQKLWGTTSGVTLSTFFTVVARNK